VKWLYFTSVLLFSTALTACSKVENNVGVVPHQFRGHWIPVGTKDFRHIPENGCWTDIIIYANTVKFVRDSEYCPNIIITSLTGISTSTERVSLFSRPKPVLRIKVEEGFPWSDWFSSYSSEWFPIYLMEDNILSLSCNCNNGHQDYYRYR
jgi:hypothetical protein